MFGGTYTLCRFHPLQLKMSGQQNEFFCRCMMPVSSSSEAELHLQQPHSEHQGSPRQKGSKHMLRSAEIVQTWCFLDYKWVNAWFTSAIWVIYTRWFVIPPLGYTLVWYIIYFWVTYSMYVVHTICLNILAVWCSSDISPNSVSINYARIV